MPGETNRTTPFRSSKLAWGLPRVRDGVSTLETGQLQFQSKPSFARGLDPSRERASPGSARAPRRGRGHRASSIAFYPPQCRAALRRGNASATAEETSLGSDTRPSHRSGSWYASGCWHRRRSGSRRRGRAVSASRAVSDGSANLPSSSRQHLLLLLLTGRSLPTFSDAVAGIAP